MIFRCGLIQCPLVSSIRFVISSIAASFHAAVGLARLYLRFYWLVRFGVKTMEESPATYLDILQSL